MGLKGNSDDVISNQKAAVSPTEGVAELVQEMEETTLPRCSHLHLGHMGCWALLRDVALTQNIQAGMGEKPKEGNKPGGLSGQRQKTLKGQTQKVRYTGGKLQKTS